MDVAPTSTRAHDKFMQIHVYCVHGQNGRLVIYLFPNAASGKKEVTNHLFCMQTSGKPYFHLRLSAS